MNSEGWIEKFRDRYEENFQTSWDYVMSHVSSPIEKVMLAQLLGYGFDRPSDPDWDAVKQALARLGGSPALTLACHGITLFAVVVQPRIQFEGFALTPDFGLIAKHTPVNQEPIAIAVELDGHDFHERTKQQASRDKKRDRSLLSKGWSVIRFTGSDVIKSPTDVFMAWNQAVSAEAKKRGVDQ